jgi:undecaprenyl-diphosphatase
MTLDRHLLVTLRTRGHSPALDRAVAAYSKFGEHAAGWLTLGALGARLDRDPQRRRAWSRGAATVAGAYAVNQLLKRIIRRPRPQLDGLPQLTHTLSQLSFPSAHSTTSFAAARAYRGLAPGWMLYGLASTLAFSRVYLGVHYPTDVLAGAALGTIVGEAATR